MEVEHINLITRNEGHRSPLLVKYCLVANLTVGLDMFLAVSLSLSHSLIFIVIFIYLFFLVQDWQLVVVIGNQVERHDMID
jgi:hypothetical protein